MGIGRDVFFKHESAAGCRSTDSYFHKSLSGSMMQDIPSTFPVPRKSLLGAGMCK